MYAMLDMFAIDSTTRLASKSRSTISEIAVTQAHVFALMQSGACIAFDKESLSPISLLNSNANEIIRSIFVNKRQDSIITVSLCRRTQSNKLYCTSVPLSSICTNKHAERQQLFASEVLSFPGFVEFDDVNGKVLTFSACTNTYKMWSLATYEMLYPVDGSDVKDIKMSCGVLLIIRTKKKHGSAYSTLPLTLINIEDGTKLKDFYCLLKRNRKIEMIEQFNEKLLIKQSFEHLCIYDVFTGQTTQVSDAAFQTPSSFIFLYEHNQFLTFKDARVHAWNFEGERVAEFKQHRLMNSDCNPNNTFITSDQGAIVSFCCDEENQQQCIGISDVCTGRSIAKLSTAHFTPGSTEFNALQNVTSLAFDEDRNYLFCGTDTGVLYKWSH